MADADAPLASLELEPPPPSLLAPGSRFEGLLRLDGRVRIDGHVAGTVVGPGALWVGETGHVAADVEAAEVVVAGELEGDVRAHRRIVLLPTARVRGTLDAPVLRLSEGSQLSGRARTTVERRMGPAPTGAGAGTGTGL